MSSIIADQELTANDITNHEKIEKTQQNKLVNNIVYDGRTNQVYKIWTLNLLLQIITLGIYRFWGETRLRKYVVGLFSLRDDWFEYTGTGKELFIGFLKAILILLGIYSPFMVATHIAPDASWQIVLLLPILYVIPVAIYSALRYRINRLQWRGIKFIQDGSSLKYANLFLWRGFLNIVSMGILLPFSDIKKYQYKVDHANYGDILFSHNGNGKNLMGIHLATYAIAIGLFLVVMLGVKLFTASFSIDKIWIVTQEPSNKNLLQIIIGEPAIWIAFVLIFVPLLLLPIVRLIYKTALIHEMVNYLHAGNVNFTSTVTTSRLCKLKAGNFFILIGTLGLGIPYILQRNLHFMTTHTVVKGDLNTSRIKQATNRKPVDAEGIQDVLNLDTSLL